MPRIEARDYSPDTARHLAEAGLHPVMARVLAARGIERPAQMEDALAGLVPVDALPNALRAAELLADAIEARKKFLIVADYDTDGATACAVALRALKDFGARVDYLVPNRFEDGYGLTPKIVQAARAFEPDWLITVDNGIASLAGVEEAGRLGIEVLVTDHHLPGDALPDAACIVNPNAGERPQETPSGKARASSPLTNLAGVGVIFYVMLALRAELRQRGRFAEEEAPKLARLLDLVALGTVADVVKLDDNNRILVRQGLKRMRAGQTCAGVKALFQVAGRDPAKAGTFELGFLLAPRLNAAGRLDDMRLGIECLVSDDAGAALEMARRLDELNRERREIEAGMQQQALAALEGVEAGDGYTLALYRPDWHQGVVGILAGRLKERFHRPTLAFAPGGGGELKGSGRSIPGLHLRDALDRVAKRHPRLLKRFGGHAMAAGVTLAAKDFAAFERAFEETVRELLSPADLEKIIQTDGELAATDIEPALARALADGIWGQGFPEPLFHGVFLVAEQRVVGERHLKLRLRREGCTFDAILFHHAEALPPAILAVYAVGLNEYQGSTTLQLTVRHWEEAQSPT
jgi:single-stranded-DNA-specific exonuclease